MRFDDPNLVSCVGLVPVMRLARRCDLAGLVGEHLKVSVPVGANAHLKVPAVVAGMIAGADCVDDLDVLRHGGMGELFGRVRAPSTLGSFLRGVHWGNVRQLEVVSRGLLAGLSATTPVLSDAGVLAHLDIDSCQRHVCGPAKQGAGFGVVKVGGYTVRLRGLNPLLAAVSTPTCAPVLVGTRLRGGSAGSARGAESFVAESITIARRAGAGGLLIARMDPKITKVIAGIDEDEQRWISDAEVAEVPYTAFADKKAHRVSARLIVRRVRRLAPPAQGELLPAWRHHAIFTDPPDDARRRSRPPRPHRTGHTAKPSATDPQRHLVESDEVFEQRHYWGDLLVLCCADVAKPDPDVEDPDCPGCRDCLRYCPDCVHEAARWSAEASQAMPAAPGG